MTANILVYADWPTLDAPTEVGTLSVDVIRGREQYRFAYDQDWLRSGLARQLDPELSLFAGDQYSTTDQNFRVFLDSCPDRWGRLLMKRREAMRAHLSGRRPRLLHGSDYLLGVHDTHRMGALRFKTDREGPFLDDDHTHVVPPLARLRDLQQAVRRFEEGGDLDDGDYEQWLDLLMLPGSSLGGARPKSSVVDEGGAVSRMLHDFRPSHASNLVKAMC